MRVFCVINERSGGGRGALIAQALRQLSQEDSLVVLPLEAESLAKLQRELLPADRVLVGGGDGSFSAVLRALVDRDIPVAVLPLGTGNDLARELKASLRINPKLLESVLSVTKNGRTRDLTVWRVTDSTGTSLCSYVNYFSVGFDARVIADFEKWRLGTVAKGVAYNRIAYFAAALKNVSQPRLRGLRVTTGEGAEVPVPVDSLAALFTNIRSVMGLGWSNDRSDPFDEILEFHTTTSLACYAQMAISKIVRRGYRSPLGAASSWSFSLAERSPVQIDGEAGMWLEPGCYSITVAGRSRVVIS